MSKTSAEPPILIAGGGIAGLSAAIALAREGLRSIIFEKAKTFPAEGAGIQLGPNATRILREWGVVDRLGKKAVASNGILIGDGLTGTYLNTVPLGQSAEEKFGAPFLLVHRADLHKALLDTARATKRVKFQMNCALSGYNSDPDGDISIKIGKKPLPGRGLVCADGVWSTFRHEIDPGAQLRDARRTAWRTLVDAKDVPDPVREPFTRLWLAPGAHLVHYPVCAGNKINVVAVLDERKAAGNEGWNRQADPAVLEDAFSSWNDHLAALVAKGKTWRCWSLYTMSPLSTWTRNQVCLLGDAAHPTLPFLAQGGAMAIEDAATLAPFLREGGSDVAGAMKRFEIERIERTARTAYESRKMGNIYHMGGIGRSLRNFALRVRKPESLLKRYDWLYGFRIAER